MIDALNSHLVGGWQVTLRPQQHISLKWKAVAIRWDDEEIGEGVDDRHALQNLAHTAGIDKHELLRAFGFIE